MMAPAQPVLGAPLALDDERKGRERELVEAARSGDGRAFASLVGPHLAVMFRLAARTCGGRALAEDAVQEALTIAARELGKYRPDTSLRAWLATIVIRRAHTLARGERRRRLREDLAGRPEMASVPSDIVGAADVAARLRRALGAMPEKRREAALLRWDAGLSHAEIAAVLGSTEPSVRVLLHLAAKELRGRLSHNSDDTSTEADPNAGGEP